MSNGTRLVQKHGVSFRTIGDDKFWDRFEDGSWEPSTLAFLAQAIRPGDVFLDIGAWIGPTTLFAAAMGATCHSFEPDPVAFGKFQANLGTNTGNHLARITPNQLAVSAHGQPIRLFSRYRFGDSGSSSLSRLKDDGSSVEVGSTRLMDYLRDQGVKRIDLIKLDIEGGEFQLLPAIRDVLVEFRPVVFLALHFPYLLESSVKADHPNRVVRGVRRSLLRSLGMDPVRRQLERARNELTVMLRALDAHAHVYTPDMEPFAMDPLPERLFRPIELVFSPYPLGDHPSARR